MSSVSNTRSAISATQSRPGPTMAVSIPLPAQERNLSSGVTAVTFDLFVYLPAELREKVWKESIINDAKIIEMKHPQIYRYDNNMKAQYIANIADHRNLLGACAESRNFMLNECILLEIGNNHSVHVNVSTDTIYFGPSSYLRDWEVLEFFDRWSWNDAMFSFIRNDLSLRLQHRTVRGLHPLLTTKSKTEKEGLKIIRKLAFDDSFLFRAKRQHIWKATIDKFPAAASLTIVTGDMGEKQVCKDVYKKHTTTIPIGNGAEYNSARDELNHQLLPYVENPSAAGTYNLDLSPSLQNPIANFGETTFEHCPSHVQETVEHLVTFFTDRTRLVAIGGRQLQAEAADNGWSVMVAKRGGEYLGSVERMDDGFFDDRTAVGMDLDFDLGLGMVGDDGFMQDDGAGDELDMENEDEEDMEFEGEGEEEVDVELDFEMINLDGEEA